MSTGRSSGEFSVPSPRPRPSSTASSTGAGMSIPTSTSAASNPPSPSSIRWDTNLPTPSSVSAASTSGGMGPPAPPPMHNRRPSLNMSPSLLSTSPRAVPVPVPNRGPVPHAAHRLSFSGTSPSDRPGLLGGTGGSLSSSLMGSGTLSTGRRPMHTKSGSISSLGGMATSPSPLSENAGGVWSGRKASSPRLSAVGSADLSGSVSGATSGTSFVGAGGGSGGGALGGMEGRMRRLSVSMKDVRDARVEEERGGQGQEKDILAQVDSVDGRKWLGIAAHEIVHEREEDVKVVEGSLGMEQAVEVLLKSGVQCLLVNLGRGAYSFFDFADLNTFLLLVLQAASTTPSSSRSPPRGFTKHNRTNSFSNESAIAEEDEPASESGMNEHAENVIKRLRKGEKVVVRDVCDISQKNPYHSYPSSTSLRELLPLFANGLHRVAITSSDGHPKIVSDRVLLEHLTNLEPPLLPPLLSLAVSSPSLGAPLHALISLPGTASVLDAMQVMSLLGLSALGVLSGSGGARSRRESSGSSGSSASTGSLRRPESGTAISSMLTASPMLLPIGSPGLDPGNPMDSATGGGVGGGGSGGGELVAVVTAAECTRLVVPSEGKQVLGMGLEEMVRGMQYVEEAGTARGEERVPVHTIPYSSTLLHASHLILATFSSRVFLRSPPSTAPISSPPLSPVPSLTTSFSSPLSSPSLSSLSLSDQRLSGLSTTSALPPPPATLLSPHYVVSTADILNVLAKAYAEYLTPPDQPMRVRGSIDPAAFAGAEAMRAAAVASAVGAGGVGAPGGGGGGQGGMRGWQLDPDGLAKRRRASSGASIEDQNAQGGQVGFESWRWAGRVSRG